MTAVSGAASALPRARVPWVDRGGGGLGGDGAGRAVGAGAEGAGDGDDAGAGGDRAGAPPGLGGFPWERAAALGPFVLADGSAAAEQPTGVRVARDRRALYVRFDCADRDAWGTWRRRNDPIYLEEAVEVFLAPGTAAPRRYWELEVSPLGVLFAARIENPTGRRAGLVADTGWECPGLEWQAGPAGPAAAGERRGGGQDWWAALAIPWDALAGGPGAPGGPSRPPPRLWRANFYRIERPRGGRPELSCWSPTWTEPPDFHRPERFGVLELAPCPSGSR